jgi:hypothetical protein
MTRLLLSLAFLPSALANATPIHSTVIACGVGSEPDALVDTGLSSIGTPLEVSYYGGGDGEGACRATLHLRLSALASRSLVPRPRELAEELVPVAKAYGAKTCEIFVWLMDDVSHDADTVADDEACRRGEFRYDGGSWSTVEDDAPCW